MNQIRVRFAPSPTGGLHLGGVRTVLYNYLFARQHNGKFILRIEDTDQNRFVPGAEEYIYETLKWCGLEPDESPVHGGKFGPYRQSERKEIYNSYAQQLVAQGYAYYAFDTPAELEEMRTKFKTANNPSPQYNYIIRQQMRNSLTLGNDEVMRLLSEGMPYVIRIKMPENEEIGFNDLIRGEVKFLTQTSDDKVLLKADGMPTYHLAVVVDDFLMKITHAFRGEEWLPSAPVHLLLWKYLFGLENMPQWAHLPLILRPDGKGKLSKRDGARMGFPVFAMDWTDPQTGEKTAGFKEKGFLPQAFVNMLALLGWNDGTEQEIFSKEELIEKFSIERIHKGGAKFDFEKAKWFNHEWIKLLSAETLKPLVIEQLKQQGISAEYHTELNKIIDLVKERCTLLPDFVQQTSYFFQKPNVIDTAAIHSKWNEQKQLFFIELVRSWELATLWETQKLEESFKELTAVFSIKSGEVLLPLRIMLVGGKFGPDIFEIATLLGKTETIERIQYVLGLLQKAE